MLAASVGPQALSDALPEYDLDVEAMAAVVHDRKPTCRPDLAAEDPDQHNACKNSHGISPRSNTFCAA